MTFLQRLLGMASPAGNPLDDRWYAVSDGASTISGVYVDSDTALKLSVVYACDRLLSETIASLPMIIYERLADGGRKRAENHPLYDVLHRQPNEYQTAFEFYDFMTHCALMRGSGYARIKAGPRGFADQLIPIHPDLVTEQVLANGGLRYRVRSETGGPDEILNDEDVLHLRGMTKDGKTTVSVLSYARESLGGALAADRYAARFWRNGARPGGVLETDQKLNDDVAKRVTDSWTAAHSGENQHKVALLEQGLKWQDVGISPEDSQLLQTREFHGEDACRWFRVPPHMVGLTSKVTSWGSGIQQLGLGFVTYTLLPWLVRWQQAITRDLILAPQKYFVEVLVDALLKGDLGERYNAYAIGRDKGWLSVNDVRRMENMNPVPGGDQYAGAEASEPSSTPATEQMPMEPQVEPPMEQDDATSVSWPGVSVTGAAPASAGDHYRALLHEAAGRVVRKEIAAMTRAGKRWNPAPGPERDAWDGAVCEFYGDHAKFVAQTLCVPLESARRYADDNAYSLLHGGPAVMADWETRRVADLVALALEDHS